MPVFPVGSLGHGISVETVWLGLEEGKGDRDRTGKRNKKMCLLLGLAGRQAGTDISLPHHLSGWDLVSPSCVQQHNSPAF